MLKKAFLYSLVLLFLFNLNLFSQDRSVLIPKSVGAPFVTDDSHDLFGKAWRFYRDGFTNFAADSLKKLIAEFGYELKKNHYYIVVANFTPEETPIGMFHGNSHFHDTRLYGLQSDSLFYIFISRDKEASSYLSTVITRKDSYFETVLPYFIGLFPILTQSVAENTTWMDVRKFEIPKKFQKNCDISVIVKKNFSDDKFLAREVFDNTSLEKWSFGIATALTSVNDVDFVMENGRIVIKPKPRGDLATFGLVNYHFKAVDTKGRTMATSFHVSGCLRISQTIEPVLGLGFGIPIDVIDLHLFAGYSVEFAQEPDTKYKINQEVGDGVDPFKLKIRGKPRIGIEVKFP